MIRMIVLYLSVRQRKVVRRWPGRLSLINTCKCNFRLSEWIIPHSEIRIPNSIMFRFPVDPNIAVAKTISTEVYTSAAILEEAREKIFAPSWQFVGDTGRIPDIGSVYPFTLLKGYLDRKSVV